MQVPVDLRVTPTLWLCTFVVQTYQNVRLNVRDFVRNK